MDKRVFSGELDFLTLSEVLQTLGNNCSTGRLLIYNQYIKTPGIIYFSNGEIIDAECVDKKADEAVLALFGWVEGNFEFLKGSVDRKRRISKGRMELIMEGLNRLDEGKTELVDPVSHNHKNRNSEYGLPVVNGPIVDLFHVVQFEKFSASESILIEGRFGSWGWVILEGTVEIRKNTLNGKIPVIRMGPGSFLGLSTFLTDSVLRTSTDIALGNVELGVLNQESLLREISTLSREMKGIIKSNVNRYTKLVGTFALLKSGDQPSLGFENGTTLIRQGKPDDTLYEILTGPGFLKRDTETGCVPLLDIAAGDFVGRLPFGRESLEPATASVDLNEEARYRAVDSALVHLEYEQLSHTLKNILDNLSVSISVLSGLICDLHK